MRGEGRSAIFPVVDSPQPSGAKELRLWLLRASEGSGCTEASQEPWEFPWWDWPWMGREDQLQGSLVQLKDTKKNICQIPVELEIQLEVSFSTQCYTLVMSKYLDKIKLCLIGPSWISVEFSSLL